MSCFLLHAAAAYDDNDDDDNSASIGNDYNI